MLLVPLGLLLLVLVLTAPLQVRTWSWWRRA